MSSFQVMQNMQQYIYLIDNNYDISRHLQIVADVYYL